MSAGAETPRHRGTPAPPHRGIPAPPHGGTLAPPRTGTAAWLPSLVLFLLAAVLLFLALFSSRDLSLLVAARNGDMQVLEPIELDVVAEGDGFWVVPAAGSYTLWVEALPQVGDSPGQAPAEGVWPFAKFGFRREGSVSRVPLAPAADDRSLPWAVGSAELTPGRYEVLRPESARGYAVTPQPTFAVGLADGALAGRRSWFDSPAWRGLFAVASGVCGIVALWLGILSLTRRR